MKKKLNKVIKDVNSFLLKFLSKQKKTNLIKPMKYGLLFGGKKIRSKLITDVGKIFNVRYKNLIQVGAVVECIHAYSLIHDDLPCMDNDSLRRGKPSTHKKFGESTAILAGNSLLTIAFEILSHNNFHVDDKVKIQESDYIIMPTSIIAHETEKKVLNSLLKQNKKIFLIGIFANVMSNEYKHNNSYIVKGEPENFFLNLT